MRRALLALPLLLLLSGCGSDEKQDDGKDAFLVAAEQVCAKANADQKALKTPTGAGGLADYVDAIVRIAEESTTGLAALTPPASDKAALDEHVLDPLEGQLAKAKDYAVKVRKASDAKDNIELARLFSAPPNETVADLRWMRSYGFRECVDAADTSG